MLRTQFWRFPPGFDVSRDFGVHATRYHFGPYELRPAERLLRRNGRAVTLTAKAFDTLVMFVENSGRLLDKKELMGRLWPDSYVEDATLSQYIFTLRKALGPQANGEPYIETVPRCGYRFVATVSNSDSNQQLDTSAGADESRPRRDIFRGRLVWLTVGVLAIAALTVALAQWKRVRTTAPQPRFHSLAVLPFKNLGPDENDQYLGLGLADSLITRLAGLGELNVRPTGPSLRYDRNNRDPLATGRALQVEMVLDGSVSRVGNRLRVSAQLYRVADGSLVWADKFEQDSDRLFSIEDSLANRLAEAILPQLSPGQKLRLSSSGTENAAAHEAYLKGRYFWDKRSESGYVKAAEYFQRAIDLDPKYAQAYSGLADDYALLGSMTNREMARSAAMPKARAAAQKALQLDGSLAEAHTSLAFVRMHYDWDFAGAAVEFQRAIALSPKYATARHWYAYCLTAQGRIDEAIAEMRRAQGLEPLSAIITTDLAEMLMFAGRYGEALQQARAALELDPDFAHAHRVLGNIFDQQGRYAEAITEGRRSVELSGGHLWMVGDLAATYALAGKRTAAERLLAQMLKSRSEPGAAEFLIPVYAALGDNNGAVQYCEAAFRERSGGLILMYWTTRSPSLHSDPRFQAVAQRVGVSPPAALAGQASMTSASGAR